MFCLRKRFLGNGGHLKSKPWGVRWMRGEREDNQVLMRLDQIYLSSTFPHHHSLSPTPPKVDVWQGKEGVQRVIRNSISALRLLFSPTLSFHSFLSPNTTLGGRGGDGWWVVGGWWMVDKGSQGKVYTRRMSQTSFDDFDF